MSRKRRRSDCPIANALEILGDRWTLVIVRDLMFRGKKEYGELLTSDEEISTNILADRLARLRAAGIVTKTPHPRHGNKFRYELTDKGLDLAPVLIDLTLWGAEHIPDTFAPPEVLDMMRQDRERVIALVKSRAVLAPS